MALSVLHGTDPDRMSRSKVSSGGQISIPASIRRRWETTWVEVIDADDHLIVRPIDDDVVSSARGALASSFGGSTDEMRACGRAEDDDRPGS